MEQNSSLELSRIRTNFVCVDSRRARLFSASPTRHKLPHVDCIASTEAEPLIFEHERPSRRKGKTTHSYAGRRHEHDEEQRRNLALFANWISEQIGEQEIDKLYLFAGPDLLSALLEQVPKTLHDKIEAKAVDFAKFEAPDLAAHADIQRLVARSALNKPD